MKMSSKYPQNIPQSWSYGPKTPNPNLKKNFLFWSTRHHKSLEGLNSSLAQSAAELWLANVWSEIANVTFRVTFIFVQNWVFEP